MELSEYVRRSAEELEATVSAACRTAVVIQDLKTVLVSIPGHEGDVSTRP